MVLKKQELSKKDCPPPKVPSDSEWRRAPFFGKNDLFWYRANQSVVAGEPLEVVELMEEEVEISAASRIPADTIFRFGVERGCYPLSGINWVNHISPCHGWEAWTDAILSNPTYEAILEKTSLLPSIKLFRRLHVPRDASGLGELFSRWSSSSHTFVTAWGEFTPTIEDVSQLLGLPFQGVENPGSWAFSPEEEAMAQDLEEALDKTKDFKSLWGKQGVRHAIRGKGTRKATLGALVRYYFRDFPMSKKDLSEEGAEGIAGPWIDHSSGLAAYLLCWLSRYILEGTPEDAPLPRLVDLAVKLASGVKIALAPLFLGTLYHRLDLVSEDMVRSVGRYAHGCYASTLFLQMFLYERFQTYSPSPAQLAVDEQVVRGMRWHGRCPRGRLGYALDQSFQFISRPYAKNLPGALTLPMYVEEDEHIAPGSHRLNASEVLVFLLMTCPGYLPCLWEGGQIVKTYNPRRVPLQFGYDRGVPSQYVFAGGEDSYSEGFARFVADHIGLLRDGVGGLFLPGRQRVPMCTEMARSLWAIELASWRDFCASPAVRAKASVIYAGDFTLRPPSSFDRGELCSFAPDPNSVAPQGESSHPATADANPVVEVAKKPSRKRKTRAPAHVAVVHKRASVRVVKPAVASSQKEKTAPVSATTAAPRVSSSRIPLRDETSGSEGSTDSSPENFECRPLTGEHGSMGAAFRASRSGMKRLRRVRDSGVDTTVHTISSGEVLVSDSEFPYLPVFDFEKALGATTSVHYGGQEGTTTRTTEEELETLAENASPLVAMREMPIRSHAAAVAEMMRGYVPSREQGQEGNTSEDTRTEGNSSIDGDSIPRPDEVEQPELPSQSELASRAHPTLQKEKTPVHVEDMPSSHNEDGGTETITEVLLLGWYPVLQTRPENESSILPTTEGGVEDTRDSPCDTVEDANIARRPSPQNSEIQVGENETHNAIGEHEDEHELVATQVEVGNVPNITQAETVIEQNTTQAEAEIEQNTTQPEVEIAQNTTQPEVEWMGIRSFPQAYVHLLEAALAHHPEVSQFLSSRHPFVRQSMFLCLGRVLEIFAEIERGSTERDLIQDATLLLDDIQKLEVPVTWLRRRLVVAQKCYQQQLLAPRVQEIKARILRLEVELEQERETLAAMMAYSQELEDDYSILTSFKD